MKLNKMIGYISLSIGLVGTTGFGAMLGIGANYTVTKVSEADGMKETKEVGVGSMNYTKSWINGKMEWREPLIDVPTINNELPPSTNKPNFVSYREYINWLSNDPKKINERNATKERLKVAQEAYNTDKSSENKLLLEEAQFDYDLLTKPFLADNLMIAGAVLTTLFATITLLSIVLVIFKAMKK